MSRGSRNKHKQNRGPHVNKYAGQGGEYSKDFLAAKARAAAKRVRDGTPEPFSTPASAPHPLSSRSNSVPPGYNATRFSGLGYERKSALLFESHATPPSSGRLGITSPKPSLGSRDIGLESRIPTSCDVQEVDGWYTLNEVRYDSETFTEGTVREIHPQVKGILPLYTRQEPLGDPRALLVTDSRDGTYFVRIERERFSPTTISLPWIENFGVRAYGRTSDPTKLLDREKVIE